MTQLQVLAVAMVLVAGVWAQYGGSYGGGHGNSGGGYGGKAESFFHFTGPVVGHAQPISVKGKYGEEIIDYVAHPHYEYVYGVADHHSGDFHGQKESRDGHQVVGEYSLKEPSGNVRTVKYVADKDGFRAEVHNSHHNTHPEGHGYSSQGGSGYSSQGGSGYSSQGGSGYSSQGGSGYSSQGVNGYGSQGGRGYSSHAGLEGYGGLGGSGSGIYSLGGHGGYSNQGGHGYSSQGDHGGYKNLGSYGGYSG